jgi:hypothetical protein
MSKHKMLGTSLVAHAAVALSGCGGDGVTPQTPLDVESPAQVDDLEDAVQSLESRMSNLEGADEEHGGRLDDLESRVDALEMRIDDLESRVDNLEAVAAVVQAICDELAYADGALYDLYAAAC